MGVPLNIDWQQILLHLLNFVVLFAILYFLLYHPVKKFMEQRSAHYRNLDDEAQANLQASEQAKADYQGKLAAVEEEISAQKEQARREVEEASAMILRQAEEDAAKIIADARQTLERERVKMLREAHNEISDMVASAAEKLVVDSSTSDAYDSFLSSVKRGGADE